MGFGDVRSFSENLGGWQKGEKHCIDLMKPPSSHHNHAVRISWKTGKECRRVHEGFRSSSSSISHPAAMGTICRYL